MEYYVDPDGYWVTYEDHDKALSAAEALFDKACEDIFDQKYVVAEHKAKLSKSNKVVAKLLIVIIALIAFQFAQNIGSI
jgi:hypothetical protein